MAFAVNCPECDSSLEVEDEHRDWTVRCPHCRHEFRPAAASRTFAAIEEDAQEDEVDAEEDAPVRKRRRRSRQSDYDVAVREVYGPALSLKIFGWFGLVLSILAIGIWVLLVAMVMDNPPGPPKPGDLNREEIYAQAVIYIPQGCASFLISIAMIFGAGKMSRLESYGWSQAAAILGMLPCVSPCCFLGLPFGIWALMVLNRDEIQAAFRRKKRGAEYEDDDDY